MTRRARHAVVLVAALAIAAAGVAAAYAASVTVSLTARGPEPATVTVEWGDTVVIQNVDTVQHRMSISRLGVTGHELKPGERLEQRFAVRQGNYPVRQQGTAAMGTVVVKVSGKIALTGPMKPVPIGTSVRLVGRSTQPGAQVTVQRRAIGEQADWASVGTVDPDAAGNFTYAVTMDRGAHFRALAADGQVRSNTQSVTVTPRITARARARRVAGGGTITVVGRIEPAGAAQRAELERWDPRQKIWRNAAAAPVAAATGRVVLRWKAPAGTWRMRVGVRRGSLEPGFDVGSSRQLRVTVGAR